MGTVGIAELPDRPPLSLRGALKHRRLPILAIIAVFLIAGGALSLRPRVYEADTGIYLDSLRGASSFDAGMAMGDLLQHDFIVLGTSRPVLAAACQSTGVNCSAAELASPETTLARRVSISVFRGTSMLVVAAKGADPEEAAALANAVAKGMIDQDRAEVTRLYKPALDDLTQQLSSLSASIASEQQALQRSPGTSSAALAHQAQLNRLQAEYSTTLGRQQDLIQTQDRLTNLASIMQPATPPTAPEAPDPLRYLLGALLAGVCVAILIGLLLERLDDRIFDADGLARAAAIPLALVAQRSNRRLPSPEHAPYSLALAGALAHAPDARSILVTAASARDHSEGVASALGTVAAHAGQRVFVLHGDGIPSNGHKNGHNHHKKNGQWFPHLAADGVTTITLPANNDADAVATVADLCREGPLTEGRFVVVAAPAPEQSPTAMMLARTTRRTILAATAGRTRFRDARRTAELLRDAGVAVVGGILVS